MAFKPDQRTIGRWSVASDGSFFGVQTESPEQGLAAGATVTVVFDWSAELDSLVPR